MGTRHKRSGVELVTSSNAGAIQLTEVTGLAAGGDSGGPLVCNNHIVAVTDLGHPPYPIPAGYYVTALPIDAQWANANIGLVPAPVTDSLYTVQGSSLFRTSHDFGNFTTISGPPSANWSDTTSMASAGGNLYAVQGSYFTKIDPSDNPVNGRFQLLGGPVWSGPTLMTSMSGNIYITEADGLWSIDNLSNGAYHLVSTAWTDAVAMTNLNGLIYIIKDGYLYKVSAVNGSATHVGGHNWSKNSPNDSTIMATVSGAIYIQNNDSIYRIDNTTTGAYTVIGSGWSNTTSMTSLDGSLFLMQANSLERFSVVSFTWTVLGFSDWSGPTITAALP